MHRRTLVRENNGEWQYKCRNLAYIEYDLVNVRRSGRPLMCYSGVVRKPVAASANNGQGRYYPVRVM